MKPKKNSIKKKAGILLTSLATVVALSQKAGLNKLEEFVKGFPEKMPYVSNVTKCLIPDSKHVVVLVRQVHYTDEIANDILKLNKIDNLQKNIYGFLTSLIKQKNINSIRLEGMVVSDNKKDIAIEYKRIMNKTKKNYAGGGAEKLIIEGKLIGKPAEVSMDLMEYSGCMQKLNSIDKDYKFKKKKCEIKHLIDGREDTVLAMIATAGEKRSFAMLGGAHATAGKKSCGPNYSLKGRISDKDNIYEWNKENPSRKFSYIEVTPKGYWEYQNE